MRKKILLDRNIPYLDLETIGCPKFNDLVTIIPEEEELNPGCGHHKHPDKHHCAMIECHAFMRWYRDYMKYV